MINILEDGKPDDGIRPASSSQDVETMDLAWILASIYPELYLEALQLGNISLVLVIILQ